MNHTRSLTSSHTRKTERRPHPEGRDGEPLNMQGTTPARRHDTTDAPHTQALFAGVNTTERCELVRFILSEPTTCRIQRRAKRHGRTNTEEVLALLQGEFPAPSAAIASKCWSWQISMPESFARRVRAYAEKGGASVEEGFSVEELMIERLNAVEAAEVEDTMTADEEQPTTAA